MVALGVVEDDVELDCLAVTPDGQVIARTAGGKADDVTVLNLVAIEGHNPIDLLEDDDRNIVDHAHHDAGVTHKTADDILVVVVDLHLTANCHISIADLDEPCSIRAHPNFEHWNRKIIWMHASLSLPSWAFGFGNI